ncbi:RmlC-like cupin domain-containing protein [Thelonectria olida]|uniref:RmlC-like cupin domain-containing protein n=1 Tax=Thelonectria olida TaxID=1576542 RepID=A0A9P9AK49_9HYPO|nr:RmlC-like cupin domain-containing protein [Thelonectria olida]
MLSNALLTAAAAIMAFPSLATAAPRTMGRSTPELSLTTQIRLVDTFADRFKLLPDDKDFVYDFNNQTNPAGALANAKTFPALVGTGTSLTVGQIPGCNMAVVHIHPRAAELQAVISGRLYTEQVPEAGVLNSENKQRVIKNELGPGQMTVFYQGSFHTQLNPDCEPAVVVTAFASEDMGTSLIADATFALDDDIIANMFGQAIAGEDIDRVRKALPKTIVYKVEECLAKCGKQKRQI